MIIRFIVSGGIAGIHKEKTVDLQTLPPYLQDYILGLLRSVDFFNLPERLHRRRGYDMIERTISINGKKVILDNQSGYPKELILLADLLERL